MLQTVQQRDRRERFSQLFGVIVARREGSVQLPPPELPSACIAAAKLFGRLDPDLICAIAEQLAQAPSLSKACVSPCALSSTVRQAKLAIRDIASLLCTCRCIESAFREHGDMLRLEVAARGQTQLWPVHCRAPYPFLDQVLREERSRLDVRMLESALTAMVTHCASEHCRGARWAHNKRIAEAAQRQEHRPATPLLLAVLNGGKRTPRVKVAWSSAAMPNCVECFGSAAASEDSWVLAAEQDGGDLVRVQNAPAPAFDPRSELATTPTLRGAASLAVDARLSPQPQQHATHLAMSPCGGWLAVAYQDAHAHAHAPVDSTPSETSFHTLDREGFDGAGGGGVGGWWGHNPDPSARLRLWRMHEGRAPEMTSEYALDSRFLVRGLWMRPDDTPEASGVVLVLLTRLKGMHATRQRRLTGCADDLRFLFEDAKREETDCAYVLPVLHAHDSERAMVPRHVTHIYSVEPSEADGGRTFLCTLVGKARASPHTEEPSYYVWQTLIVTCSEYGHRDTEAVTGLGYFLKQEPTERDLEQRFRCYNAKTSPCQTLVVGLGSRRMRESRRLYAHVYRKRVEEFGGKGNPRLITPFELVHVVHTEVAIRRAPSSQRAECDGVHVQTAPTCFCFSPCGRFAVFALERVEMKFLPGRLPRKSSPPDWEHETTAGVCVLDLSHLGACASGQPPYRVDFGWVQCRGDLLPRRMRWNRAGLWLSVRGGVLLLGA